MLGVPQDAGQEEIRRAYLRLVKLWHPDAQVSASPASRAQASAQFRLVQAAWECLSHPQRRAAYDSTFAQRSNADDASMGRHAAPRNSSSTPDGLRPATWVDRAAADAVASRPLAERLPPQTRARAAGVVAREIHRQLSTDLSSDSVSAAQRSAYFGACRALANWSGGGAPVDTAPNLAQLVEESLWASCHLIWNRMGPDTRRDLPGPPEFGVGVLACAVCGSLPASTYRFRAIRGRVVLCERRLISGAFCRDCALAIGRDAQSTTVNAGWWGLVAIPVSVVAIARNGAELRRARDSAAVASDPGRRRSSLDPGPEVRARGLGGLVLFVVFVAVLLTVWGLIGG